MTHVLRGPPVTQSGGLWGLNHLVCVSRLLRTVMGSNSVSSETAVTVVVTCRLTPALPSLILALPPQLSSAVAAMVITPAL
jgi:hypothetical protein